MAPSGDQLGVEWPGPTGTVCHPPPSGWMAAKTRVAARGLEDDPVPLGRPGALAVAVPLGGELAVAGAVGAHQVQLLRRILVGEEEPVPVRRERLLAQLERAAEDRGRAGAERPARQVERRADDLGLGVAVDEDDPAPVGGDGERTGPARRRGERLGLAVRRPVRRIERQPPEIERSAAGGGEVEPAAVVRVDRGPVERPVVEQRDGGLRRALGAVRRHAPEVALEALRRAGPRRRSGGRRATRSAPWRRARRPAGARRSRRAPPRARSSSCARSAPRAVR